MKLDAKALVADLEAASLPMAEKDAVLAVDTILKSLKKQADAQMGDAVAGVVSLAIPIAQPMIDAAMAKAMPAASQA